MALTHEECQAMRACHKPMNAGGAVSCVFDSQTWPCDAARLLDLAAETVNFMTVWQDLISCLPDDYGCWLQCVEANAAADLFRALGDEAMADVILDNHAPHDTEEEDHWERGEQVRARRAEQEASARELGAER